MNIVTGMVCALQILSTVCVNSSLVSKYTKPAHATSGRCKKCKFIMEKFISGFCKQDDLDLTLYDINAGTCIQECRARTMCKSINMFTRVNICRINFQANLTLKKCKMYSHSDRANWTQKTEPGCESLNCSIIQKCIKTDGKYSCVYTECMNILHLQNGMVFGNHLHINCTRAFMCNQGYELKGASLITCQGDGNWSHEVPVCVAKAVIKSGSSEKSEPSILIDRGVNQGTSSTHSPTLTRTSETAKTSQETLSMTTATKTNTSPKTPFMTKPTKTKTTKTPREIQSQTTPTTTKTSTESPSTVTSTTTAPKVFDSTVSITTPSTKTSSTAVTITDLTTSEILQTSIGTSNSCPVEIYSEANCENSDKNTCPFPQVFVPRKDKCEHDCGNYVFGTTYQGYPNKTIISQNDPAAMLIYANNQEECLVTCRGIEKCVAISVFRPLHDLRLECKFFVTPIHESLAIFDAIGQNSYLRNCQDIDQDRQLPFYLTIVPCSPGELFSESQQECITECNQDSPTFQLIDNHSIDIENLATRELYRVLYHAQEEHFMDCLAGCVDYGHCALVLVKKHSNMVDCDFYSTSRNYSNIFVRITGHKVFLRNCE